MCRAHVVSPRRRSAAVAPLRARTEPPPSRDPCGHRLDAVAGGDGRRGGPTAAPTGLVAALSTRSRRPPAHAHLTPGGPTGHAAECPSRTAARLCPRGAGRVPCRTPRRPAFLRRARQASGHVSAPDRGSRRPFSSAPSVRRPLRRLVRHARPTQPASPVSTVRRTPRSDAPDLVDLAWCSGARAVPAGAGVRARGPCAPGNDRRAPRVVAGTSSICGGRQCSLPRPLSAVPTPGTTRRS